MATMETQCKLSPRWNSPSSNPYAMTSPEPDERDTQPKKGSEMWNTLRSSMKETVDKVKKADGKPVCLSHGIHHFRRMLLHQTVYSVTYNKTRREYICLDSSKALHIYLHDGRLKQTLSAPEPFTGIVYASHFKQYVAWNLKEYLKVLNAEFEVISTAKSTYAVHCCQYSEDLNEIVTAGNGHVSVWSFRFGHRYLVCRKLMREGFSVLDKFSHITLDKARGRFQRCFAVCETGVAVFNLQEGTLITYKKELHLRTITSAVYSDSIHSLVTASRDGSIKVWDENWNVRMVFVGHTATVTALALYPYGPLLLSASEDETIRTWNLETADEVDIVRTGEPVVELYTEREEEQFFSFSTYGIDLWRVNYLYSLYTKTDSCVISIKTVNLSWKGNFPIRSVCMCQEGSILLVAPETGVVLTTLLLEKGKQIMDSDYCLPTETLFVLTQDGDILKANALTNPMTVLKELKAKSNSSQPSCLLVYNYIVNKEKAYSEWREAVNKGSVSGRLRRVPFSLQEDKNRYLLIVGQEDGFLSVLDWNEGCRQFMVEAHSPKKVSRLLALPDEDYIVSAGMDDSLKVWRVFPYAEEALSLHMSFFCFQPTVHMTVMRSLLIVAFQNPSNAIYSIVQYNLMNKNRTDHPPGDDPKDEITGLCSCPTLKIFASSSRDGIVKIWDYENRLLRNIFLNAVPESISFCSNRGDLLVGIGRHLYCIGHEKYLPNHYKFKMVCMEIPEPIPDPPISLGEAAAQTLSSDALRRIKASQPSMYRLETTPEISYSKEDEEYEREIREKNEAYIMLAERDNELLMLQQGELKNTKQHKRSKRTASEAFEQYMQILYGDRSCIQIPKLDRFELDNIQKDTKAVIRETHVPMPEIDNVGFFPYTRLARSSEENISKRDKEVELETAKFPVRTWGVIPNSTVLQLLWPIVKECEEEEEVKRRVFRLPSIPAEQLTEVTVQPHVEPYHSLELDMGSPSLSDEEEEEEVDPSALVEKFTTKTEVEEQPAEPTVIPKEPEVEVSPIKVKATKPQLVRPVKKLISIPKVPVQKPSPPPPSPSPQPPPPPASPLSPPVPLQQLPGFIAQFKGSEWFESIFPDAYAGTFPEPSVRKFVKSLLEWLLKVDYSIKAGIIGAITTLCNQEYVENIQEIHDVLISILNQRNPPSLEIPEQKTFITYSLNALKTVFSSSKDVLIELMVQFLMADSGFRKYIVSLFLELGLWDTDDCFCQEMDSWNLWATKITKAEIRQLCSNWLEDWIRKFKNRKKVTEVSKLKADSQTDIGFRPIDVVNYFCELTRIKKHQRSMPQEKLSKKKNAVLDLPHIERNRAIFRLGETNSMARKRQMADFCLPAISSQPLLSGFVPYINLPVKKISLNPFPSPIDLSSPRNVFLTLNHMAPKYFVLDHTFPENYY
ncbi:WD repeat-containing protein 97 isoform X2 [Protopterus annectens]|uniref:WD repeat-containing protein 97 isoform X2 n=1 Tax=Protopterus annectens TaxID=7888 RepID=UPI001CFAD636|nr:WD repeat-containing protein 97 isoform X2 [Protopterus annectens]